ncbi:MAG: Na/Pi cotransporter family protein [Clostridia bacterium]|nr:Na/Pi cotransporter family protein [Clostridia bacterium]
MMAIWLLGGLGLFLYGMHMMADGLESAAGNKLKFILEKVTENPFSAVLVGAVVTALIQSSSATTVMVVGFVNSGILNLIQATGIIMGANIGTTVTAFLVSINVDAIVPLLLFSGTVMVLFSKAKKRRDLAMILLGLGIILLGMETMGTAMAPLKHSEDFKNLIASIGGRWYIGVLLGLGITLLVQSSSATTGILIALTETGQITIEIAWPIILGANIGTCITALLSSITANKTAKRASIIHLLFNLIGAAVFMPFGPLLISLVKFISPASVTLEISFIHLIFNTLNTLLLMPFAGVLIRLSALIVGPDAAKPAEILDKRLLQTPSIAEGQVILETVKMAELAKKNFGLAMDAFLNTDLARMDEIYANEKRINELTELITRFMVELSGSDIDINEFARIGDTYHVINDIERIGDHAENIIELAEEKHRREVTLSEEAQAEIREIYKWTLNAINTAIESYRSNDKNKARSIVQIERTIDALRYQYRETHIQRLNEGVCSPLASILFLDLLSNIERVGDHSENIANAIADVEEELVLPAGMILP